MGNLQAAIFERAHFSLVGNQTETTMFGKGHQKQTPLFMRAQEKAGRPSLGICWVPLRKLFFSANLPGNWLSETTLGARRRIPEGSLLI